MKVEKTFKRDNGNKIVITVQTTSSMSTYTPLFDVSISIIPKGKHKPSVDTRSCSYGENVYGWDWRKWNLDERAAKTKEYILQFVTIEEIRETRDELLKAMSIDSYRF